MSEELSTIEIPVAPVAPAIPEIPSDVNQHNASSYVDGLSKEQLDAIIAGTPSPKPADGNTEPEPADQVLPVDSAEPVDPVFSPEDYANADPKTKAIYDKYLESLEALENAPEIPQDKLDLLTDPFIKARVEYLQNGFSDPISASVPYDAIANEEMIDGILESIADEDATPEQMRLAIKSKIIEAMKVASEEAALRVKGNLEIEYSTRAAAAQERAWAEAAFPAFATTVPEFKTAGPILVPGADGGMVVNPENKPAREFVEWIGKNLESGEFSNAFVKSRGFDKMYQIFRMDKAESAGGFVANLKSRTRSEILSELRNAKNAAMASSVVPTLPAGSSARPTAQTIHGVDIGRIKAGDEGYAKSVFASPLTLAQMNDVMKAIQS